MVRPSIIVVLELGRWVPSMRALRRARALAERDRAKLLVLIAWSPALPAGSEEFFRVLDALMKRVAAIADAVILLRTGETFTLIRRAVAQERPSLLVVAEATAPGATWADLATTLDLPILVARRWRKDGLVFAATDATDRSFPILSRAVALAPHRGSLVVFHLFDAWKEAARLGIGIGDQVSTALLRDLRERRVEALRQAVGRHSAPADIVVASGHEAARAVLEQCARADPDLVVIGAHRLGASARERTAAALIERLEQSVLVVPVRASSSS